MRHVQRGLLDVLCDDRRARWGLPDAKDLDDLQAVGAVGNANPIVTHRIAAFCGRFHGLGRRMACVGRLPRPGNLLARAGV